MYLEINISEFKKGKGTAHALSIALRFGFGMIGAAIVSVLSNETIFPYIYTILVFSIMACMSGLAAISRKFN